MEDLDIQVNKTKEDGDYLRTERIKLKDWLSGNCEYKGCKYNDGYGICEYDDGEFLDDISNVQESSDVTYFDCKVIEVPDGVCEFCDHELKKAIQRVPYGDTTVPYALYECKNPNC